ncbi:MAG: glycosyltransferase family 2 protein [bacterium]|nr:glycosyltransferase family 2 protein [bacterium]
MKKIAIIISPNYKDYAQKYLSESVDSIRKQDYAGEIKIFIADNESTEESYNYLKSAMPEAEIVRNKNNDGFAKGNNDCLKLALEQGFEYLMCLNMDAVMTPDCARKMVEAVAGKEKIGAVQARLMLYDKKNIINSLGNATHFLGFGYSLGNGEEYNEKMTNDKFPMTKEICYPSGAAVLFTGKALKKVGLFDQGFWMYNEDQDLGWRLWLFGFSCVLAPAAVVYHKYEFSRSIKKYYWMDRNRIISVLKNYHFFTLILVFPAGAAMELGLLLFAARQGWLREKLDVYKYFLSVKNWRYILAARQRTQELRRVKDKEIVRLFSGKIWYQEIDSLQLRLSNIIFNAYWKIIRVLIIW